MQEKYTDYSSNKDCYARIIIPDDKTKEQIANELEKILKKHINIKGIIASNIPDYGTSPTTLGPLWNFMCNLKLKHFGDKTLNTGAYRSFDFMKSALTPARKSYTNGTGSSRFDMIIYEKETQ